MNRITLTIDEHGSIVRICADAEVEIYFVEPSRPEERVYRYGSTQVGPEHVDEQIDGWLA